jgi:prepilin-type processing-associated H-X9-DG protein
MDMSPPVAVGDYAASIGTTGYDYTVVLPGSPPIPPNGVFRAGSSVRFGDVTDGLSSTLMVGEKHVPRGMDATYPFDCGLWDGHNPLCSTRGAGPDFPLANSADTGWKFGSRHPNVCQFVFCDGSVHPLTKTINPVTLGLLAQRDDGQVIPDY